jgi:hypothetical protein
MEGSGMDFEELDSHSTPLGELSLRRRTQIALGVEVCEVKLGDVFLMSSWFTEGEIALWSNDPPDDEFGAALAAAFAMYEAHVVRFHNPQQRRDAANTVYVARTAALPST